MAVPRISPALLQFVDDELLRAPLLLNQVMAGTLTAARKSMATMPPGQRSAIVDLIRAMQDLQTDLSDYFLRSLRDQVDAELLRKSADPLRKPTLTEAMALVDEDEVALDVELSHTIEAIKSNAEFELRELQTYISAMVGDPDVSADHNPFRAETFARALWDAAQALPLSRGHHVAFVRHAGPALAEMLRISYAASTSRLEALGIEPAAYRTLILPSGSRRGGAHFSDVPVVPDLVRMRETMPAPMDHGLSYQGQTPPSTRAPQRERWTDVARAATSRVDRQAIELVSRLFDAMIADERVPADVILVISRLHGPAMRLTLRDGDMLDQDGHPLWRFINRIVYEAEMAPDAADPERSQLLKTAQATVDQLASEPEQSARLYDWAIERLDVFLRKRLARRLSAAASQIGALQKLEDKLLSSQAPPSTLHGMFDVSQLDTVPATLLPKPMPPAPTSAEEWLDRLRPGDWVRMFIQGRWTQPQLLWPGERQEVWLFGDGASDATWAVRRSALLLMHKQSLLKSLKVRSIVGTAAAKVHEELNAPRAA